MSKCKRMTAVLLSGLMTASLLSANAVPLSAAESNKVYDEESGVTYNTQDDWLHVEGDKIVDMNGNEVWLTGCNWFGYNVGSQVFDGVWSQNMHEMLNQIADHGFNLLRVPMSTQILLQWRDGGKDPATPKVNQYCNPELTVEGVSGGTILDSFTIWSKAVQWCRQNGIKIMIDIHSAATDSAGHQVNLWYTDKYSTQDWCDALYWFADYYKNDDTIIAIDLKNEPHGKADVPNNMAKWDGSSDANNWRYAAEVAAASVMKANPNLLVMVEGNEVYPKEGYDWTAPAIDYTTMTEFYYGAWWGGNFRGVRKDPVNLGEHQSQLVYSPHDYGPLVYEQTWFNKDFTTQTLLDDYWYDTWAFIAEEHIAPLLIGEWGGFIDEHDKDGKNRRWMTLLRDYMIKMHIHHTFWCFNENSGDTGGLVYDNFGKWDEEKYELVRPALWQDNNGVFISLDHEVPLGQNGQSINDFYGNGGNTGTGTGSTPKQTSAPDDHLYGDVNEDGQVTVSDAILLSRISAEDVTVDVSAKGLENADVNGDGAKNSEDTAMVLRYVAKLITLDDLNPHKGESTGGTTQTSSGGGQTLKEKQPEGPFYLNIVLSDDVTPVLNMDIAGKHYKQDVTDFKAAETITMETVYDTLPSSKGETLIRIAVPYSVGNIGSLNLTLYGNTGEGSSTTFGIMLNQKVSFTLCKDGQYFSEATIEYDGKEFAAATSK